MDQLTGYIGVLHTPLLIIITAKWPESSAAVLYYKAKWIDAKARI